MDKLLLAQHLDSIYKLAHLKVFFDKFVLNFLSKNKALCEKFGVPLTLLNSDKIQSPKKIHIDTLTPLMFHKELFLAMIEAMPPDVQTLIKDMVWIPSMSVQEISAKYNIDAITSTSSKHINATDAYLYVTPLLLIMNVGYESGFYLYFTHELRSHLRHFFEPPSDAKLQSVKDNEIDTKLLRYEQTDNIFTELPILRAYYAQGQIKINENSQRPNVSSLNKIRKVCNIREFYGKDADKALHNIRSGFLIELFLFERIHRNQFDAKPTHQYIKSFYDGFLNGDYHTERLLPHIKGWNNTYTKDFNYNVNKSLDAILKNLPLMEWISTRNILTFARLSNISFELVNVYRASNVLYTSLKKSTHRDSYYYYYDKGYIKKSYYEPLIVEPMIKGFLMLCASLGMLEMVFKEPKTYLSGLVEDDLVFPYEGVEYIRLTAFGAYVLGRLPSYTPPKVNESKVELDENALFIHYSSQNQGLLGMIESISRRAGNNLFKVDFETVLGKCNSKKEIDMQINTFKKLLSDNPPQIWTDFFSALKEKSYVFSNKNEEYIVYILPENKELINLFAKDEYLKKHVIRAEYYHILIPRKSLSNIKKHLKKSGFLIEFE